MWFEQQNKKLQEKRCNEETKATLNQWAHARGRMEAEFQRKKEHVNAASNFQKARGFVRTNWKSKNFDPSENPCDQSSSTDDSELARQECDEDQDKMKPELIDVASMSDPSCRPSVQTQLETLAAIQEYNKKLPKRRKAKDSIPEMPTSNIAATFTVKRDHKKKTLALVTHYNPVGITDGCQSSQHSADKFSLANKQAEI